MSYLFDIMVGLYISFSYAMLDIIIHCCFLSRKKYTSADNCFI